jgi:hypothetical protein
MLLAVHKMSRKVLSESQLRRRSEEILKHPVTKAAWQIAVEERMVSQVLQGEDSEEWLAKKVERLMDIIEDQAQPTPRFIVPKRRQRRGKTIAGREEAISKAVAELARQSEEVQSFRSKILSGELLKFADVEQWITNRARDSVYPHALLVRIERDSKLYNRAGRQHEDSLSSVRPDEIEGPAPTDSLHYGKPDSSYGHCVPVGRDGTLRVVYELSKKLANEFRWQEAEATVFLLTDLPPRVVTESFEFRLPPFITPPYEVRDPKSRTSREGVGSRRHLVPLDCLARVSITVDPFVTPQELKEKYAKLRGKLLSRKPRAQSEKNLQLAVFAVKHPALDKAAMIEWGRVFPKWAYHRVSLFGRDARDSRDRLLHYATADIWSRLAKTT